MSNDRMRRAVEPRVGVCHYRCVRTVTSTALVVDVVEEGRDTLKACRLLTGFWGAGMYARVRLRTRICTQLPLLQLSPENSSRIPFLTGRVGMRLSVYVPIRGTESNTFFMNA